MTEREEQIADMETDRKFAEWAVVELFGHRKLAGMVSEQEIAGRGFVRLEVPGGATQFYSPQAVYCITPTTEDLARDYARLHRPRPVERYELTAGGAVEDPFEAEGYR